MAAYRAGDSVAGEGYLSAGGPFKPGVGLSGAFHKAAAEGGCGTKIIRLWKTPLP
jgi:hypothetical protein